MPELPPDDTPPLPASWQELLEPTARLLPWREEDGVRVLGATFETATPPALPPAAGPEPLVWSAALATPPAAQPQSMAQYFGELVHAALQGLQPAAPAALWAAATAHAAAVRTAQGWVFGPGSRAEVAIALPGGRVGRIDRVVPHEGCLWLIDFKTGARQTPVPVAYQAQLQGYAAALLAAGEARPLKLAVLWVEGAQLAEVPLPAGGVSG